ncbi:MAG: DUF488 domain-containing protein [Rhodospirillales bacterium]|nr:DUF488 domain-containing protein [Rhodospirillales bacterium]
MPDSTTACEHFFTIGHSTRSISELAGLLHEAGADCIADVRSVPRSRTNPQFNEDTLPAALAAEGLHYRRIAALGGWRKPAGPSPNTYWENSGFRNYADYAGTAAFRSGLQELRTLAHHHRPAIMCAEAVWWRCHRRIIADYLLAAGADVRHILGHGKIEPARMTKAAVKQPDGTLIYVP